MSTAPELLSAEPTDWDARYREGTPPWDTGRPAAELVRMLDERSLKPGRVLEIGCGTGDDAICLARHGFEVTAVDSSPLAIERARVKLEETNEPVRFVLDDVFEFAAAAGEFDLVYDAGFYHFIRLGDLNRFLDMLWRVTRPGSFYFALIGASGERARGGPPQVTKDDIHDELGRLFDFIHLRRFAFEGPRRKRGYKGWSCLMQRPAVAV